MKRGRKLTREVADVHGSVQAVHLGEDDLQCNENAVNAKCGGLPWEGSQKRWHILK